MSRGTWPPLRPETAEWATFTLALAEHRTPCAGAGAWTSDDPTERAEAVEACQPCPLVDLCHAAAESTREAFGVWAGVDRAATKTKAARQTARTA